MISYYVRSESGKEDGMKSIIAIVLALAFASSCSRQPTQAPTEPKSRLGNSGNKADKVFGPETPEYRAALEVAREANPYSDDSLAGVVMYRPDQLAAYLTLRLVRATLGGDEVTSTQAPYTVVKGDEADVTIEIHLASGRVVQYRYRLERKEGRWGIFQP
jgi:hypothetical protein